MWEDRTQSPGLELQKDPSTSSDAKNRLGTEAPLSLRAPVPGLAFPIGSYATVRYLPYSPNLAPSDIFLFPTVKSC
ncbi:hypothetical protein TNCV_2514151 [Trichonephila clavipes]|nr:hypothetical protein TNCV_2514151 [Trichonephila clavipes]